MRSIEDMYFEGDYEMNSDCSLMVKMDGPTVLDVYHIGKWPKVFGSAHYKNGHSWNIRYRSLTVVIPNLVSFLKYRFGYLSDEIKYAWKSFLAVRSGFVQMESQYAGEWEKARQGDAPYYICALFGNGRHIPLPILNNWNDENSLQKLAIRLAGGAPSAIDACAAYQEE